MTDSSERSREGYHPFLSEDGEKFGSFEVFWVAAGSSEQLQDEGWYWHSCHPGCLPDSDASGPHDTSIEAYESALSI